MSDSSASGDSSEYFTQSEIYLIQIPKMGDRHLVCAVFMPMLPGYEAIRAVVLEAIDLAGATMWRLEDLMPDAEWQLWVTQSVETADIVLADVTDNNAFVMYELGVAHSHRTPTLLIVNRRNGVVPATVKGSFFLSYSDDQLPEFISRLANAIRHNLRLSWNSDTKIPIIELYAKTLDLLASRSSFISADLEPVTADIFSIFIEVARRRGEIPMLDGNLRDVAGILLARMVNGSDNCQVMDLIEQFARECTKENCA